MSKFTAPAYQAQEPATFLYTLTDSYLAFAEAQGDAAMAQLNDEQHTLLAYCYLDSQMQEGGFVQLIASGYGEYIFMNPLADSLRRWRIKLTPKIIEQAKALYTKHGADIESLVEANELLENIRSRFPDFEELDSDYYETADEDLATAAEYVQTHLDKFVE